MRSYLVRSSPARWVAEVEERRHLRSSALKALAAYSDRSTINLNCGTMLSTSTHTRHRSAGLKQSATFVQTTPTLITFR